MRAVVPRAFGGVGSMALQMLARAHLLPEEGRARGKLVLEAGE